MQCKKLKRTFGLGTVQSPENCKGHMSKTLLCTLDGFLVLIKLILASSNTLQSMQPT